MTQHTPSRRKPGRPPTRQEPYKPITIQWPVDILQYIKSITHNRTAWLIDAARQKMIAEQSRDGDEQQKIEAARQNLQAAQQAIRQEQDHNARIYIMSLLQGEKAASIPDVGEWEHSCMILTHTFDTIPEYLESTLQTIIKSEKGARLRDILA